MKQHIQGLIEKFWSGELNAAEKKALFEQLQNSDPEWEAAQEKIYQQSLHTEQDLPVGEPFFEKQYALLLPKLELPQQPVHKPVFRRTRIWSAAAAALVFAVSSWYLLRDTNSNGQANGEVLTSLSATSPLFAIIANTTDSIQQHWLSDGSLLRLHSGSAIRYNSDFGKETRSIQLQYGQVYFLVAKDKAHPFIVKAGNTLVRAVGTAFTVSSNTATQLLVTMQEGRVAVTPDSSISQSDIMLAAGDKLDLDLLKKTFRVQHNKSTGANTLYGQPEDKSVAKKIKLPAFRQIALQQVFKTLIEHYQVNIRFDTAEVEGLWFTGEFTGRETLASILATICRMNQLEVQFEEKEFVIKKK